MNPVFESRLLTGLWHTILENEARDGFSENGMLWRSKFVQSIREDFLIINFLHFQNDLFLKRTFKQKTKGWKKAWNKVTQYMTVWSFSVTGNCYPERFQTSNCDNTWQNNPGQRVTLQKKRLGVIFWKLVFQYRTDFEPVRSPKCVRPPDHEIGHSECYNRSWGLE